MDDCVSCPFYRESDGNCQYICDNPIGLLCSGDLECRQTSNQLPEDCFYYPAAIRFYQNFTITL